MTEMVPIAIRHGSNSDSHSYLNDLAMQQILFSIYISELLSEVRF